MLESARDQFFIHVSGQHHHGEVACLGVRDAKAINEFAGLAHLIQDARERRAATVDHGHLMLAGQLLDRKRGALQEPASSIVAPPSFTTIFISAPPLHPIRTSRSCFGPPDRLRL